MSRSPRTIDVDIQRCEAATPASVFTSMRRYELSLRHKKLSPRARQSIQMKLAELEKKVQAAKADCIRKTKHSRAIQEAQAKAERRQHESAAKAAKYAASREKFAARHEKSTQAVQLAAMRKEAGIKSPTEKTIIGLSVAGVLGGMAWLMFGQ